VGSLETWLKVKSSTELDAKSARQALNCAGLARVGARTLEGAST
jgi:hypothetical protein